MKTRLQHLSGNLRDNCEERMVDKKSKALEEFPKSTESKQGLTKQILSAPSHPGIRGNEIILKIKKGKSF